MSSTAPAPRPGTVTAVVVLTWLSAIGAILGGVLALTLSETVLADAGLEKTTATTYGIVELIIGVIIALVALGLGRGNNTSRILTSILMVLRIAASIWAAFTLPNGVVTGIVGAAVSLIVLVLLWNEKANAFFATN
jgi:hypothetical protein